MLLLLSLVRALVSAKVASASDTAFWLLLVALFRGLAPSIFAASPL